MASATVFVSGAVLLGRGFLEINREGTGILMVTHDGRMAGMCERILYILDGEIRGELRLGKFSPEHAKEREKKTTGWLEDMGW